MVSNQNEVLKKTFFWMFLGLMFTGIISWYTYTSEVMAEFFLSSYTTLVIVQLVVVLSFSFLFKKLSPMIVGLLFFVYAGLNGLMFSSIFYVYELNSIIYLFFGAAILFLILSLVGYNTDKDVSSIGKVCMVGLLIGIIMTIINIFLQNSMLDIVLSWALLVIFCGLTIYDVNRIKLLTNEIENDDKLYIYFAMQLYLDFINIFLKLLSLFGKER